MKSIDNLLEATTISELKQGFSETPTGYSCLACDFKTEQGIVYPHGERFLDARKAMEEHFLSAHQGPLAWLLSADKRITGLTDRQKELITLFAEGTQDAEIERRLGVGSRSTVRNHRFALRERAKQAKAFLAVMELADRPDAKTQRFVPPHVGATMVDDRYAFTEEERAETIEKFVKEGRLVKFPMKQKGKLAILGWLAAKFEPGRSYSEREVNSLLREAHDDHVTLRRYLVEYGFIDREPDGSSYWLKT